MTTYLATEGTDSIVAGSSADSLVVNGLYQVGNLDFFDGGAGFDTIVVGTRYAPLSIENHAQVGFHNFEAISFLPSTSRVDLYANQFGDGLISNAVLISFSTGDYNPVGIHVFDATNFSAAGWTFANAHFYDNLFIEGTSGNDAIIGSSLADIIATKGGQDSADGGAGDDTFHTISGDQTLVGGLGNDRFEFATADRLASSEVDGTAEAGTWDVLALSAGFYDFSSIANVRNIDQLSFTDLADPVHLILSNQLVSTADSYDVGHGGALAIDNSALTADAEIDGSTLEIGHGFSVLSGSGSATLTGGSGNDGFIAGAGDSTVAGGAGVDTVFLLHDRASYSVTNTGGTLVLTDNHPDGGYFDPGPNGRQTVSGVEFFQFNDVLMSAQQVGNHAPVAHVDAVSATEDIGKTVLASSLLANDTDSDGDTLHIYAVAKVDGGTVRLDAQGNVLFTPTANFHGDAHFIYRAADALSTSATVTVTVHVASVADAPVIVSNGAGTTASINVAENRTAVTAVRATDGDGDALSYSISGGLDRAKFSINAATGVLQFIGAPDFEQPSDSDHNNKYNVIVKVTDGVLSDTQSINVGIANIAGVQIGGYGTGETIDAHHAVDGIVPTNEEDSINGGGGGDYIDGRGGNDKLLGGNGNDTLTGGLGKDSLTGGANADYFRFNAALGSINIDTITDFSHSDDTIQLENAIMTALDSGWSSALFRAATSGHTAANTSQHIIYDKSNGTLWYDSNGSTGGSANAVQIAQLGTTATHPTNIDYTDFAVV